MKFTTMALLALSLSTTTAFVPQPLGSLRTSPFSLLRASTLDKSETSSSSDNKKTDEKEKTSLGARLGNSGMASAAAMATAAVNAAVAMKPLEAPDAAATSFVARSKSTAEVDEEGLPLVYDKDLIQAYWSKERGALNKRWGEFVGKAVPFFTKLTTLYIRDGQIAEAEIPALSRQARLDLQELGPTFIKAGQMMSVRPDVLPPSTMDELKLLQDSVVPFDTETAVAQIEAELGGPLGQFFTSISKEPVAAASLAQVYLATLNDGNNTRVALKIQRPNVLGTVSKDLYVLRRAAEVFNGLVQRFAPQQKTDYVALLNEFAIGFYTELDFVNEMNNQKRLKQILTEEGVTGVMVPDVFEEYCTRRLLVTEWVDGKKLSDCTTEEIKDVTPAAQEAFLTQLFCAGFMHADPHPGNLLYLDTPTADTGAKVAIIDCGLMASVGVEERDYFISAVIHLANKDYAALVDDFVQLQILPPDSNRAAIIPLMDKALSPYVKGGGAKGYEKELKKMYGMKDDSFSSQVGGFQAMTQDALTVLESIPFSIPASFALLGRAIVTLEGVALVGNPEYGIIMESYPFIARRLLREGRPEIQKALQEVLYTGGGEDGASSSGLKLTRLLALLNNAAGSVVTKEGAAFVDLDSVPEDGISLKDGLKYVLSDNAASLRVLLEKELDSAADLVSRQVFRRALSEAVVSLTPPRPPSLPFLGNVFPEAPALDEIPLPLVLPGVGPDGINRPSVGLLTLKEFGDVVAPRLTQDEEIFAIGLAEGAREFFGDDIGDLVKGEKVLSLQSIDVVLKAIRSGLLGRQDLVSAEAAQATLGFLQNSLSVLRQRTGQSDDLQYTEAMDSLSADERARLDEIVNKLTQSLIERTVARLESVDRIVG